MTDKKAAEKVESVYTLEEFLSARTKVFGTKIRQECIVAAFRLARKTEATESEAKKIVNDFLKRRFHNYG